MKFSRFSKFTIFVLVFNIGVILWGAYVRATGSGAGCGSHWPLCDGVVIPRSPQLETVIEYTHRFTSGIALILVFILLVWAFRIYPKGHIVRKGALLSMSFIVTEALVGAGLVLFKWVAGDVSSGRVISISVHLINTFILLACLTLTSWWASSGKTISFSEKKLLLLVFSIGFIGIILIGISGAVTALGDTLFKSESLIEGIRADFNPAAHFLVRLRIWHPILAIITGFFLIFLSLLIKMFYEDVWINRYSLILIFLVILQLSAGVINLLLLAPVWMQIIHLLLADLLWIIFVLLFAVSFQGKDLKNEKAS
jgi:heme A synthase